jgi:hypothetical protein
MRYESPPIFISYRNNNADNWAAAIMDMGLTRRLGADAVFWASRSIPLGAQFHNVIHDAIVGAQVMLVLMGDNWAQSLKAGEHPWVINEIKTAQQHNVRTIPVRLGEAPRPKPEDFPEGIDTWLAGLVSITLTSRTHEMDIEHLANILCNFIPGLTPPISDT